MKCAQEQQCGGVKAKPGRRVCALCAQGVQCVCPRGAVSEAQGECSESGDAQGEVCEVPKGK